KQPETAAHSPVRLKNASCTARSSTHAVSERTRGTHAVSERTQHSADSAQAGSVRAGDFDDAASACSSARISSAWARDAGVAFASQDPFELARSLDRRVIPPVGGGELCEPAAVRDREVALQVTGHMRLGVLESGEDRS